MKKGKSTLERLDKFLSNAGLASRNDIKKLLKMNEITVNGERATRRNLRVKSMSDQIMMNGTIIKRKQFVYYLLNKPKGVLSTTDDSQGRSTVIDLIDTPDKIYPVGRLDLDTHGLILLTNDGELTHRLLHPKYHVPKVYRLIVAESPTPEQLHSLRTGVLLRDGITLPAEVAIIPPLMKRGQGEFTNNRTILQITLHEGRNRQIRRMCEAVGITLLDLQRITFGPLTLGKLKPGEYRTLTKKEIKEL